MQPKLKCLKKDGFVIFENVLDLYNVAELLTASRELLSNSSLQIKDYKKHRSEGVWECGIVESPGIRIAVDILGKDRRIDQGIEKILSKPEIYSFLEKVLGKSFRLTQVTIREARFGDDSLNYHQDTDGEMGICLLLADCKSKEGTTTFIKGSHWIPFTIRDLFIFPRIDTRLVPDFLETPATGKAGDAYIFINRTWHARHKIKHSDTQCAIFMSFFPAGISHNYHSIDKSISNSLGPTIQKLTVEDIKLQFLKKNFVKYQGIEPVDPKIRQLLMLDDFKLNYRLLFLLSPIIYVNKLITKTLKLLLQILR